MKYVDMCVNACKCMGSCVLLLRVCVCVVLVPDLMSAVQWYSQLDVGLLP